MQVSGLSRDYKQQFHNPCLAFSSAEPGPFPASCLHQHPLLYLAQRERRLHVHTNKPSKKYHPQIIFNLYIGKPS